MLRACFAAAAMVLCVVVPTLSQAGDPPALNYRKMSNWVCRPNGCTDDLSATVLNADGSTRIETFHAAANPQVDCFHVYPTVSHSPGTSAAARVTVDERRAVVQQAERFSAICRLFVPLYRQVTATSMLDHSAPRPSLRAVRAAQALAQGDVLAAWDDYIAHDNGGRGVVLIGHSQGAGILIELIRRRLDGGARQRQLISAILPGAIVLTPLGQEVGGTFKTIRPCHSDRQIGCVISFNMVRRERPIPVAMLHLPSGLRQVCTNPAALGGGSGRLRPYLSTNGDNIIPELTAPQPPWTARAVVFDTPFVTEPDLFEAACDPSGAFVAVSARPQPNDTRTGKMTGDWILDGAPEPTMGLHLIDLNLAAGNLVEIVRRHAETYLSEQRLGPYP